MRADVGENASAGRRAPERGVGADGPPVHAALAVDEAKVITERAAFHKLLREVQRREHAPDHADREDPARLACRCHHALGVLDVGRHRLLAEHVAAGPERLDRVLGVMTGRAGDDRQVRRDAFERFRRRLERDRSAEESLQRRGSRGIRIDETGDFRHPTRLELSERAGIEPFGHGTAPNEQQTLFHANSALRPFWTLRAAMRR